MDAEPTLLAFTKSIRDAIESVDGGCSHCVDSLVNQYNNSLSAMGAGFFLDYTPSTGIVNIVLED